MQSVFTVSWQAAKQQIAHSLLSGCRKQK